MTSVNINPEIYNRIVEEIRGTEMQSVDDYVNFVLAEVLGITAGSSDDAVSKEIEESMKKLGYM